MVITVRKEDELIPSDEGDRKGLELGMQQGDALSDTIRHMINDIAEDGREVRCGEYLVGYAVEKAEGLYRQEGNELRWNEPGERNVHVEAWVRDAADGRFIPGLDVEVTLERENGDVIGRHKQELLWHPYLYHYGRNWEVPASGTYKMTVSFDPPQFPRHDKKNGIRFKKGATATFDNVQIRTGHG